MNKIVGLVIVCLYLLFVIILTLYLFMYNRFGVSSLGENIVFSNEYLDSFSKGSLIIIKRDSKNIKVGDQILYYNFYNMRGNINEGKIKNIEIVNKEEKTIELENGRFLSSSYLIGKEENAFGIPLIGYVIKVLSSTLGYLSFVIFPTTVVFFYQLNNLFKKLKFLR
ncbi:MAG: hypothetical protein GX032_03515 [Tenericutes bacterium]|nr:hypothetical protein [Bacilli bacterium]MDD4624500.1 hypothetical protein [Bacilli bacterium]NLV90518.1 hypothetical protein [Mycoplasmatota bacterium]